MDERGAERERARAPPPLPASPSNPLATAGGRREGRCRERPLRGKWAGASTHEVLCMVRVVRMVRWMLWVSRSVGLEHALGTSGDARGPCVALARRWSPRLENPTSIPVDRSVAFALALARPRIDFHGRG